PRPLYGWRRFLLRVFGAHVDRCVRVYPSAWIFAPWNLEIGDYVTIGWCVRIYCLAKVSIGARSTVSQYAHLCAGSHDFRKPGMPFDNRPIRVGKNCWICADAFVGNGVNVGDNSVVGARAVIVRDVPENVIMAGNPGRIVGKR
ncbi:MAG: putative colanic acid biosynthesis acetyltransferase, partial [Phototrophicales bacterium]